MEVSDRRTRKNFPPAVSGRHEHRSRSGKFTRQPSVKEGKGGLNLSLQSKKADGPDE